MDPISIIGMIVWIITNLPSLIALVKSIIDLIHQLHPQERKAALSELKDAYKQAKAGNSQPLKDLHDRLCEGVGCPTDIKQ